MGQTASSPPTASPRSIFRHARDPAFVVPLALVALILAAASARTDEDWMRDLRGYWKDPFERGLAAIALAEQAPQEASVAVDPLVAVLDGPLELLRPPARRALRDIASQAPDVIVRCLLEDRYVRDDTRAVLDGALRAAGARVVEPLLDAYVDAPSARETLLETWILRIGTPAIEPLVERLRVDPAASIRGRIPDLLQRLDPGGSLVFPGLRESLADTDSAVRAAAACAIARIQIRRASRASPGERSAMLSEVLGLGDAALPGLIDGMGAPQPKCATFARSALLACARRWSVWLPGKLLDGSRGESRGQDGSRAGLEAFERVRSGSSALPELGLALESPRQEVRSCAAIAIWLVALDAARSAN